MADAVDQLEPILEASQELDASKSNTTVSKSNTTASRSVTSDIMDMHNQQPHDQQAHTYDQTIHPFRDPPVVHFEAQAASTAAQLSSPTSKDIKKVAQKQCSGPDVLNAQHFVLGKKLGSGSFATVFLAQRKMHDKNVSDGVGHGHHEDSNAQDLVQAGDVESGTAPTACVSPDGAKLTPFRGPHHQHLVGSTTEASKCATPVRSAPVVVKKVDRSSLDNQTVMNEVAVMRRAGAHPNLVRLHGWYVDPQDGLTCLVMGYCPGGTLAALIKGPTSRRCQQDVDGGSHYPEPLIMAWLCQLLLALHHLHTRNIIHRDLKPENIFMSRNRKVLRLGDLGVSRQLEGSLELAITCLGTPYYMSPEVIASRPYTYASDVWSLGCVLYEMAARRPAFESHGLPQLMVKIMRVAYEPLPTIFSKPFRQLVACLMRADPEDRPSTQELLQLPFVRKHMEALIGKSLAPAPGLLVTVPVEDVAAAMKRLGKPPAMTSSANKFRAVVVRASKCDGGDVQASHDVVASASPGGVAGAVKDNSRCEVEVSMMDVNVRESDGRGPVAGSESGFRKRLPEGRSQSAGVMVNMQLAKDRPTPRASASGASPSKPPRPPSTSATPVTASSASIPASGIKAIPNKQSLQPEPSDPASSNPGNRMQDPRGSSGNRPHQPPASITGGTVSTKARSKPAQPVAAKSPYAAIVKKKTAAGGDTTKAGAANRKAPARGNASSSPATPGGAAGSKPGSGRSSTGQAAASGSVPATPEVQLVRHGKAVVKEWDSGAAYDAKLAAQAQQRFKARELEQRITREQVRSLRRERDPAYQAKEALMTQLQQQLIQDRQRHKVRLAQKELLEELLGDDVPGGQGTAFTAAAFVTREKLMRTPYASLLMDESVEVQGLNDTLWFGPNQLQQCQEPSRTSLQSPTGYHRYAPHARPEDDTPIEPSMDQSAVDNLDNLACYTVIGHNADEHQQQGTVLYDTVTTSACLNHEALPPQGDAHVIHRIVASGEATTEAGFKTEVAHAVHGQTQPLPMLDDEGNAVGRSRTQLLECSQDVAPSYQDALWPQDDDVLLASGELPADALHQTDIQTAPNNDGTSSHQGIHASSPSDHTTIEAGSNRTGGDIQGQMLVQDVLSSCTGIDTRETMVMCQASTNHDPDVVDLRTGQNLDVLSTSSPTNASQQAGAFEMVECAEHASTKAEEVDPQSDESITDAENPTDSSSSSSHGNGSNEGVDDACGDDDDSTSSGSHESSGDHGGDDASDDDAGNSTQSSEEDHDESASDSGDSESQLGTEDSSNTNTDDDSGNSDLLASSGEGAEKPEAPSHSEEVDSEEERHHDESADHLGNTSETPSRNSHTSSCDVKRVDMLPVKGSGLQDDDGHVDHTEQRGDVPSCNSAGEDLEGQGPHEQQPLERQVFEAQYPHRQQQARSPGSSVCQASQGHHVDHTTLRQSLQDLKQHLTRVWNSSDDAQKRQVLEQIWQLTVVEEDTGALLGQQDNLPAAAAAAADIAAPTSPTYASILQSSAPHDAGTTLESTDSASSKHDHTMLSHSTAVAAHAMNDSHGDGEAPEQRDIPAPVRTSLQSLRTPDTMMRSRSLSTGKIKLQPLQHYPSLTPPSTATSESQPVGTRVVKSAHSSGRKARPDLMDASGDLRSSKSWNVESSRPGMQAHKGLFSSRSSGVRPGALQHTIIGQHSQGSWPCAVDDRSNACVRSTGNAFAAASTDVCDRTQSSFLPDIQSYKAVSSSFASCIRSSSNHNVEVKQLQSVHRPLSAVRFDEMSVSVRGRLTRGDAGDGVPLAGSLEESSGQLQGRSSVDSRGPPGSMSNNVGHVFPFKSSSTSLPPIL